MLSGLTGSGSLADPGTSTAFDPTTGLGSDSLSGLGAATSLLPTGSLSGLAGGSGGSGGGKATGSAGLDDMLDGLEPASAQFPTALDGAALGGAGIGGASDYSGLPIGGLDSSSGLAPASGYATAGGPFEDGVASSAFPSGSSALGAGTTTAASGAGSSGMPMMPGMGGGMGGAGNGNKESDRERTTWLAEDDEVWGTDPDCAPAVVGREAVQPGRGTTPAPAPRTGGSPYGPARTGTQRPGRA
jgi:hypothetical protein